MRRPTAAFFCAAAAVAALSAGVSYAVVPDRAEELSVTRAPQNVGTTGKPSGEERERARTYPEKKGRLVSPFLPEHPTREQARAAKTAPAQKKDPKEALPAPAPAKGTELRLVGVVSSEAGRRAILSVGKRHILLAPGEEKDGVMLVSLTERTATVSTAAGERELSLSAGIAK